MSKIVPDRLSQLRDRKGWSQEELAKKANIDKQTIWRIEKGKQKSTRERTVEQLAKALKSEPGALTGEMELPQEGESPLLTSKSQFKMRLSNAALNALTLAERRYDVSPNDIIELAPFLFCWAAEASLRWRGERLADIERALEKVDYLANRYPPEAYATEEESLIADERQSIDSHDVRGVLPLRNLELDEIDVDDEAIGNGPFGEFLRHLVAEFDDVVVFEGWSDRPVYRVCPDEASKLVGGDQERANEILSGRVSLNELPKELREGAMPWDPQRDSVEAQIVKKRAEWVRATAERNLGRIDSSKSEDEK